MEKCERPTTVITHVGLLWDTANGKVSITEARKKAIKQLVLLLLERKASTAADILELHGKLTFVSKVLQPARCMLWHLRKMLLPRALRAKASGRSSAVFHVPAKVVEELRAWLSVLQRWSGDWLLRSSAWQGVDSVTIHSEACESGEGAFASNGRWFSAPWPASVLAQAQRKQRLSLPFLELRAAADAVIALSAPTSGRSLGVTLLCDCLPVVHVLTSGYCEEEGMAGVLFELAQWCVERNVYLRVQHLSSQENALADDVYRARVADFLQRWGRSRHSRALPPGQ